MHKAKYTDNTNGLMEELKVRGVHAYLHSTQSAAHAIDDMHLQRLGCSPAQSHLAVLSNLSARAKYNTLEHRLWANFRASHENRLGYLAP